MTPVELVLVRHARPADAWGAHPDPGLDDVGRAQAEAVGAELAAGPHRPILTSPKRRARETAAPLARIWGATPIVEPGIGELTAPAGLTGDHGTWLRALLAGRWSDQPDDLRTWRDLVVATVRAQPHDAVLFSHFIALNVIAGAATGDDRVTVFRPGHCARLEVRRHGHDLEVVRAIGAEGGDVLAG